MVAGSPIVNLVNIALLTAVKDGASDIHIEPDRRGTHPLPNRRRSARLMNPPPGMHAAIVSRVKVIGKMDIAVKRLPQEGRVRIVAEGREICVCRACRHCSVRARGPRARQVQPARAA